MQMINLKWTFGPLLFIDLLIIKIQFYMYFYIFKSHLLPRVFINITLTKINRKFVRFFVKNH